MEPNNFSIKESIKIGFRKAVGNFWFFALLILWLFLIYGIAFYLESLYPQNQAASFLISLLANCVVFSGLAKINLEVIDEKKPKIWDLFSQKEHYLRFALAQMLYLGVALLGSTVIYLLGLCSLYVPQASLLFGVLATVFFLYLISLLTAFFFYPYYIVDKKFGVLDAFRASFVSTQGSRTKIAIFFLLLIAINSLGFLAFGAGLFLTLPLSFVSSAYIYRRISANPILGLVFGDIIPGARRIARFFKKSS